VEELGGKIRSYEKYEKELLNLKDFLKLLSLIRDIYGKDGAQKELRNISRPLIEEKTRDLFERFNFEYSDIKLDDDYDVTIYGPTGKSSLDMISGGEKIAVALALRLGITQVLSGGSLELIMLDEPTIHLDAYRRQELIDLLKKMSIIPQMIIVTHDTDLEDAADNILRIEKEEGNSFIIES
jgi:exonuclease SbcC